MENALVTQSFIVEHFLGICSLLLAGNQYRYEARSNLDVWEEAKDENEVIQLKNTDESIQPRNETICY